MGRESDFDGVNSGMSDFSTDSDLRAEYISNTDFSISGLTELPSESENENDNEQSAQLEPLDLTMKVKKLKPDATVASVSGIAEQSVIAPLLDVSGMSPIRISSTFTESERDFAAAIAASDLRDAVDEASEKTIGDLLNEKDSEHGLVRAFQEKIERDIQKIRESVAEMYQYVWHPERYENRDKNIESHLVDIDNTAIYIALLGEKMKERLQRKRVRTSTPISGEPACKRVLKF